MEGTEMISFTCAANGSAIPGPAGQPEIVCAKS